MATGQEIMKEMAEANIYLTNKKIEEAPFDKIMTGIIKSNGEDKGTYNVEINGELYNNIPSFITTNINDTVKICYPQNNSNQMFILGKYGQDSDVVNKINSLENRILFLENQNTIKYLGNVADLCNITNLSYSFIGYITGNDIITSIGLPTQSTAWYKIIYLHHPNNDGWATRLAFPYGGTGNVFYESNAAGFVWSSWFKHEGTSI